MFKGHHKTSWYAPYLVVCPLPRGMPLTSWYAPFNPRHITQNFNKKRKELNTLRPSKFLFSFYSGSLSETQLKKKKWGGGG